MFKFLTTKFNLLVPKTEAPPLRDLQIDHSFHLSWFPNLIISQPACCANIDICYIHMFAFKLNLLIHQKSFSSSVPPNKIFLFCRHLSPLPPHKHESFYFAGICWAALWAEIESLSAKTILCGHFDMIEGRIYMHEHTYWRKLSSKSAIQNYFKFLVFSSLWPFWHGRG